MTFTENLLKIDLPSAIQKIIGKVLNGERIEPADALALFEQADLGLLGLLANEVNTRKNGNTVFFNQNFHIEPTNICVFNCTFCSYRRAQGQDGSWESNLREISHTCQKYKKMPVTEVHVTGGVHPKWDLDFYGQIISAIKHELPSIHVKAFSAVELDYIFKKANLTAREGIKQLIKYGLDSIPGGGAEIANKELREKICPDKSSWERWLEIHEAAHLEGLSSNATMLYGHIENYQHRIEHMEALRQLQDKTHGFNCFIPLKFKAANNTLSYIGEVNSIEVLKNFAVARIYLDNFRHLKAYWPMLGKQTAQLSLHFGVNDIDGTIDDSTKIYTMAGSDEQRPTMTVEEICELIRITGKKPTERDSVYNPIREY